MKKATLLTVALNLFVQPVWAQEDLVTSHLADQARHWQQKARDDIAADIWRSLLRSDPRHGEALVKLGLIEFRSGNLTESRALLDRASRVDPLPRGLGELASALGNDSPVRANLSAKSQARVSAKTEITPKIVERKPRPIKGAEVNDQGALTLRP